jgi:rhodanese-related sulfurtransferase
MEELRKQIREDEFVLIDVRPEEEYRAGHLPHALSMPLEELKTRLDELNPRRTVVAYCRGPYCVYADYALEMLAARGFRVARLEEGVAEWQQAGYAVERSS